MDEYFFISFDSTSYALQAESFLKDSKLALAVIPTPREVTESCGLSIKIDKNDVTLVKEIICEGNIKVRGIYHLKRENGSRKVEKIE